jgi:hypothetical protein
MRALTMPDSPSDRRVLVGPKYCIGDNLALAELPDPKKMLSAHDCDRSRCGWFSSQESGFVAGKSISGTT